MSVLQGEEGQDGPNETAIWGTGDHNSLVVIMRALFTWRLRDGGPAGDST